MRLLEIKKKLEHELENGEIVIKAEPAFGGQSQRIDNSRSVFTAIDLLKDQSWNNLDFSPVEQIKAKYGARPNLPIDVEPAEFDQLSTYVNQLNRLLPVFLGVVDGVFTKQAPQEISIRLSDDIRSVTELNKLTDQVASLSKVADIDGKGINFVGFDKGSDWINILVVGATAYTLVVKSLRLAQEILKTRKEYFNSQTAKVNYLAALKSDENFDDEGFAQYQERVIKIQTERGVDEISAQLESTNGFEEGEIKGRVAKTVDCLVNIIGNNNEVHVSLNPPSEVTESSDGLVDVDYSYLQKGKPEKSVKQITDPSNDKKQPKRRAEAE